MLLNKKNTVQAMQLPVNKLRPFEGHPFKVTDDAEMDQLVFSILTQGLLTPISVRPIENGEYEVISGHRRLYACKKAGIETITINNNPETVSTDFDIADKLYFEPLTPEDVMNIIDYEKPEGVIVSLGGQTAINLAEKLDNIGVKILGSSAKAIALAEDREQFENAMQEIEIPMPKGYGVYSIETAKKVAEEIGYPVLVRPSFVLGGRMMHIVHEEKVLIEKIKEKYESYLRIAVIAYDNEMNFYNNCGFEKSKDASPMFITSLWT